MMTLLRFHVRYSRMPLLLLVVFTIALVLFGVKRDSNMHWFIFLTQFAAWFPTLCMSHLFNEPFSKLIRTFPIAFAQFVKSAFIYALILYCGMIFPVLIILAYHFSKGNMTDFTWCFTLGIFAFSIVTTGGALKAHFKHPANSKFFSGSDIYFFVLFIAIPHTLLCLLFSFLDFIFVGALITPMICIVIFYQQYKASIKLYEQAELL